MGQGDYVVGYGKPPKATQFKKGQSGNPKGRAKGTRNMEAELEEVLCSKVEIQIDGKKKTITRRQAVLLRISVDAAKGNVRAAGLLLRLAQDAARNAPPDQVQAPTSEEDRRILERYVARAMKQSSNEGGKS